MCMLQPIAGIENIHYKHNIISPPADNSYPYPSALSKSIMLLGSSSIDYNVNSHNNTYTVDTLAYSSTDVVYSLIVTLPYRKRSHVH